MTTTALIEAICLNIAGCQAVVAGYGDHNPPPLNTSPNFHHVMLVPGERGALPRCPVCAEKSLNASPYPGPPPDEQARFPLGLCSMTPGVERLLTTEIPPKRPGGDPLRMVDGRLRTELYRLTQAHARGEWPGVDEPEGRDANERAIRPDVEVLEALQNPDTSITAQWHPRPYVLDRQTVTSTPELNGQRVLIVTEAGRHQTQALLLEER